ncbi:hypothetical protein [uncultured Roseobacter sp.]|uniref:hypothetical protein n=1 Tax=uncultured Roseobacter sp. TaxID=114847 RepID=UPI0026184EAE|nr:hypothetical protein [uncultured Roseobacter sp.]
MRVLALLLCLWCLPGFVLAQSRTVLPEELELSVTVETTGHRPLAREMVILTIHGIYRRHITREALEQPDFAGFSWTQLGADTWREERIGGEKVKTMTRRMAIYPDGAGELTIGAFTHNLTLTDEQDEWFEHAVRSEPVTISVDPAPVSEAWWFPVRDLRISDQWSNAPDQLKRGEGVLRVIRVEAVGVTPEMLPPMPELRSPSGIVFPHPDKRLVELSPEGPISYAFWRWTIRPGNDTSTVVEPVTLEYFDTHTRQSHSIEISAQRIAYGDVTPPPVPVPGVEESSASSVRLPGWSMLLLGALVFAGGLASAVSGWRFQGVSALHRFALLDPLTRHLRQAARAGNTARTRRVAAQMLARDGPSNQRQSLLRALDKGLFARSTAPPDLVEFARRFVKARPQITTRG